MTATAFSTSAYESIAMGVPAIAIMPGATDSVIIDTFIPVFGEYIPIAKDSKRVYDLIKSLVYDRGYKAKVNKILSKVIVDGKATERVKNLALSMINKLGGRVS